METNTADTSRETRERLTGAQIEAIANADAHTNNAGLPTYTELAVALKRAQYALAAKADEQDAQDNALLDRLSQHVSVEHGWHENPGNHTLRATLFFGDFDPRPHVGFTPDGHGFLTQTLLDRLFRAD